VSVQLDVVGLTVHVVKPLHVCANAHTFWSLVVCCGAHSFKPRNAYVCAQVLICAVGQSKPAGTLELELTRTGSAHSEWPFVLPFQPKVVFVQD